MKDWKSSRICQSAADDATTKTLKLACHNRPSGREEPAVQHYQTSFQGHNNNIHMCLDHLTLGKASAVQHPLSVKCFVFKPDSKAILMQALRR